MLSEAVIPNNPKNTGNKPTKHPGQAPPRNPPKIPRNVKFFPLLFRSLNSLDLRIMRLIFVAIKPAINMFKSMNGIPNFKLLNNTSLVMYNLLIMMFKKIYKIKIKTK